MCHWCALEEVDIVYTVHNGWGGCWVGGFHLQGDTGKLPPPQEILPNESTFIHASMVHGGISLSSMHVSFIITRDFVTSFLHLANMRCVQKLSFVYDHTLCLINPRCTCAVRVTILGLTCVCLSALILALRTTRRPKSDTNGFSATLA